MIQEQTSEAEGQTLENATDICIITMIQYAEFHHAQLNQLNPSPSTGP